MQFVLKKIMLQYCNAVLEYCHAAGQIYWRTKLPQIACTDVYLYCRLSLLEYNNPHVVCIYWSFTIRLLFLLDYYNT